MEQEDKIKELREKVSELTGAIHYLSGRFATEDFSSDDIIELVNKHYRIDLQIV